MLSEGSPGGCSMGCVTPDSGVVLALMLFPDGEPWTL